MKTDELCNWKEDSCSSLPHFCFASLTSFLHNLDRCQETEARKMQKGLWLFACVFFTHMAQRAKILCCLTHPGGRFQLRLIQELEKYPKKKRNPINRISLHAKTHNNLVSLLCLSVISIKNHYEESSTFLGGVQPWTWEQRTCWSTTRLDTSQRAIVVCLLLPSFF